MCLLVKNSITLYNIVRVDSVICVIQLAIAEAGADPDLWKRGSK